MRNLILAVAAAALAACGENAPSSSAGAAKEIADELTGDAAGAASDNPVCKLFTAKELAVYAGEPLAEPQNAAMGSGCQWISKDDVGDVLIQIVSKDYHLNPDLADGYKPLPDIGEKGNVSPSMGGFVAAAIVGEESIVASVQGEGADAAQAEALLRETIKRRAN